MKKLVLFLLLLPLSLVAQPLSPPQGSGSGGAGLGWGTNVMDVSTSGSDTTAQVGNAGLPSATLQWAAKVSENYSNFLIRVHTGTYNLDWPLWETNSSEGNNGTNNFPNFCLPGHQITVICDPGVVLTANDESNGVAYICGLTTNSWLDWWGGTFLCLATNGTAGPPTGGGYVTVFQDSGGSGVHSYPSYLGLHGVQLLNTNCEDIYIGKFPTNAIIENCIFSDNFDCIIFRQGTASSYCLFRNNYVYQTGSTNTIFTGSPPYLQGANVHGPEFDGGTVTCYGNTIVINTPPGWTNQTQGSIWGYTLGNPLAGNPSCVMTNYNDTVYCITNGFNFQNNGSALYIGNVLYNGFASLSSLASSANSTINPIVPNGYFVTNTPVISGGFWTNTYPFVGTLTIGSTATALTGSMRFTNIVTGEWFQQTNTTAPIQLRFQMAPNDYLVATQITGTVTINSSSFRP